MGFKLVQFSTGQDIKVFGAGKNTKAIVKKVATALGFENDKSTQKLLAKIAAWVDLPHTAGAMLTVGQVAIVFTVDGADIKKIKS
jgi:hypothetical protein